MGKKTGQAQRVKGNVQPSSSAKAAEMIQQISSGFVGFNLSNDVAPIGVGTLLEDAFDSSIDSDFRMSLKKLYKKDALTKFKALEEFKALVETKSQEDCVAILPYWSKSYTKLTLDADRKVRETSQQTHEKLCAKVNKSLAPHLKTIMPYWILAQSDTYQQASKIAEASFKAMFNETKQPEVVYFAREEILNVLHDLLIVQTAKTLSDMKTSSEDEAQQKYETVMCNSLRGLDLFLKYFFQTLSAKKGAKKAEESAATATSPEKSTTAYDKLNTLIFDQKFWKYSRDNSTKIKSEFFQLLSSMIDVVLLNPMFADPSSLDADLAKFHSDLKAKLVPLVFYACDEDSYSSCFHIWTSIAKCLKSIANDAPFWSLLNVKKTFVPKVLALLRHHANGTANSQNVDIIYSSLPILVKQIQPVFDDEKERLEFHTDLYARMYDGVIKENPKLPKTRFAAPSSKIKILEAFFECLYFTIKSISETSSASQSEIEFSQFLTTNYVLNLTYQYMEGNQSAVSSNQFAFENKFKDFLENIIQKSSVLRIDFWSKLGGWLNGRMNLENSDADSADSILENVLNNFCSLFEPFWRDNQVESTELVQILATVFKGLLSVFNSRLASADKKQDQAALTSALWAIKKLSVNFSSSSLLDYFSTNDSQKSLDNSRKLEAFNSGYLVDLFTKVYQLESDALTFELVDLFLIINTNYEMSGPSLVGLMNKFLFELNENVPFSAKHLVKHYFSSSNNLVMKNDKTKAALFEWIYLSDKFHEQMLHNFLNANSLFNDVGGQSDFKLAIQFMDGLNKFKAESIKNEQVVVKKAEIMKKFNESLVQTIIDFLETSLVKQQQSQNETSTLRWIRKNSSHLNELNNLVLFALGFLFGKDLKWTSGLDLSIDKIWSVFMSSLQLKADLDSRWRSIESSASTKSKIKDAMSALPASTPKNLDELLSKTSSRLAELLSQPGAENYQPFISYRNKMINSRGINSLKAVTLDTISYLKKHLPRESYASDQLKNEWTLNFYTTVLFTDQGGFESYETILADLLAANASATSLVANDLLTKLYMDERFRYLYGRFQSHLAFQPEAPSTTTSESLVKSLLQVEYGLAVLQDYFSQQTLDGGRFIELLLANENNQKTHLKLVEVLNLLTCTMVLNFHDSACLFSSSDAGLNEFGKYLVKSIRNKADKLFFGTKFLKLVFSSLNGSNESYNKLISEGKVFVKLYSNQEGDLFRTSPAKYQIKLNNLSMLLGVLVELGLENRSYLLKSSFNYLPELNEFVQNFIRTLAADKEASQANLKELQYYLYDLPFAKYLLVSHSLNEGEQDSASRVKYFYGLLSQLIEQSLHKVIDLAAQLKQIDLNSNAEQEKLQVFLAQFNFNLDIFVRYLQVYLEILVKNSSASSDLSTRLLNISEETLAYLNQKFVRYIDEGMNAFINLKTAIAGFNAKSTKNQSGYCFYYDFDSKTRDNEDGQIKWQQFLLLDKLNTLLRLFFKDFKLYLKRTSTNQVANTAEEFQLSQYLSDKHWDFILCYLASVVQRLNKVERLNETLAENIPLKILTVGLYDLVYVLAKCMRVRVRDNKPGSYPKNIYADWNAFFTKEIFDPLLCLFVKVADHYADEKRASCARRSSVTLRMVRNLSAAVSLIPAERLVFNDLEPKFNVLDSNSTESVLHFTDALKTVFNHLTPHLKHDIRHVKLATYKVLKEIMKKANQYYAKVGAKSAQNADEEGAENEEEEGAGASKTAELNIIESLPQVVRQVLKENLDMFADLKSTVQFDQSILINELDPDQDDDEEETDEFKAGPNEDEDADDSDAAFDRQTSVNENYAQSLKLEQMRTAANKKYMTTMFVSRLILDMFSSENLEFNVKMVNILREMNFNEILLHFLFRVMPTPRHTSMKLFAANLSADLEDLDELQFEAVIDGPGEEDDSQAKETVDSFTNRNVQIFACKLYKYALKNVPAMIRDWWNIQPKRIADYVDNYTTKNVSPVLLEEEIRVINRYNTTASAPEPAPVAAAAGSGATKKPVFVDDDEQSSIKIRGMLSSREIVSTYKMKELNMELIIHLPVNHPLGIIEVSSVRRIGVDEKQWRNWLLQLTTYLTHQNGSIIQSLLIWKKNVDKKFSGVEECTICYNVIHGTNYQLPKIKCRTCRKLFHSVCLYKWFESSSKSTCPLCRNLFYF